MSTGSSIDSGTGTPTNGRGVSTMPVAVAGSSSPVRWVVLFTGRTATDDYQPSATIDEKPALVKEVTDVCVAFHPHSDIRLFPASGEAVLFYRTKSTSEWIVTRVATAPNPDGVRTALEYCSVVLTSEDFKRLLGGNPFAAIAPGGMMDRVREHFLSGEKTPIQVNPLPPVAIRGKGGDPPPLPFGAEGQATPENTRILQEYFAARGGSASNPPTFATWWSSGGGVPSGCFEIVLRAPVARAVSLRDAADAAAQLATEVKAAMPRTPADDAIAGDLARSILASADAAQQAVSHASSHLNTETPAQFTAQLTEAARLSGQMVSDIAALTSRLGSNLKPAEVARLNDMAQRGEELVRDLPRVRHPNPFGRRAGAPDSGGSSAASSSATSSAGRPSAATAARSGSGGNSNALLIGGGAVALLAVFGAWGILGHKGAKTGGPTPGQPTAKASPTDPNSVLKAKLTGVLASNGASIEKDAKAEATKGASAAAHGKSTTVPEAMIDKITATALNNTFKQTIPADQYSSIFGSGGWSYQQYTRMAPSQALALSVHEAAMVAATQDVAKTQINKIKTSIAAPQPTPTPRIVIRTVEAPAPERPTHRRVDDTPKPEHHKNAPAAATPKAGSADSTGL